MNELDALKDFYEEALWYVPNVPIVEYALRGRAPVKILDMLLRAGERIPPNAIELACNVAASADHLRCLLLRGADVDSEKHVLFELHYAEEDNTECFELLLAAGIDLSDMWTAVFKAAAWGACECDACSTATSPEQVRLELMQIVSRAGEHIFERLLKELLPHAAKHLENCLTIQRDAVKAVEMAGFKAV